MDQHPLDAEAAGQGTAVLAAGAAEADQHRAADVMAPLYRDAPDRLRHPLIGDRQCALGQPFQGQGPRRAVVLAQGLCQLPEPLAHHRRIGPLVAGGAKNGGQRPRRQAPQQQVGIGHRQGAAAPIAGRAGIGPGGVGPHQQPLRIGPQDRAPACGDRVDRQHRRLHLQPGDLGRRQALPGVLAAGSIEMEHIGGGAAHVEADDRPIPQARRLGRGHRSHHAAGRAGEDRVLGLQLGGRLQGATGGHHPQARGWPQGGAHLGQIAPQGGPHRRFDDRGVQARHQAGLATELMGQQHRVETELLQPVAEGQLMGRMAVAVQQGHGDVVVAVRLGLAQQAFQAPPRLQGHQFASIGGQPGLHLDHPQRRQLGALDPQGEDLRAMLIADGGQIGETAVDQQQHRLQLALQQGVGGHGGTQAHLLHQARRQRLISGQPQHLPHGPDRRIVIAFGLHRQHLAHHQLAAGRATHQVGEGATPIDPEAPAAHNREPRGAPASFSLCHRWCPSLSP